MTELFHSGSYENKISVSKFLVFHTLKWTVGENMHLFSNVKSILGNLKKCHFWQFQRIWIFKNRIPDLLKLPQQQLFDGNLRGRTHLFMRSSILILLFPDPEMKLSTLETILLLLPMMNLMLHGINPFDNTSWISSEKWKKLSL